LLSRLDPEARRLLLRVPLAAAAALAIWFLGGSEVYGRALAWATETALRLFERPPVTFLTWDSGTVQIRRTDFSSRSQIPVFRPASVCGNTVLLLALYLSTPGAGTRQGLLRGALALFVLFLTHIVHFALAIETIYATQLGAWSVYAYERWQREIVASGRYFFDIALKYAIPFVVWGIFVLLPELNRRELDAAAAEARNAQAAPLTWRQRRKQRRRR
jgi:hypothetical protein